MNLPPADNVLARLDVPLQTRAYPIVLTRGQNSAFGAFARTVLGPNSRHAFIACDERIAHLVPDLRNGLQDAQFIVHVVTIPSGETSKSLEQAKSLWDQLIQTRADRNTAMIALGGGMVGDLAGFVAATYARGIPLLMVPTTLLAQVDSAVGGKVAINHPHAKNIIGCFHQPAGVWIDLTALSTLPDREYRSGLAEVVKYGVILDPSLFEYLETHADLLRARDEQALEHVILTCCKLKAEVVARDEREETGLRAILNFGHTIGHALERVAGYGGLLHGEAVAIGMVLESRLSEGIGWITAETTARLERLLRRYELPIEPPPLPLDELRAAMALDKKNARGRVRFVLPRALGCVELTEDVPEQLVLAVLSPRE